MSCDDCHQTTRWIINCWCRRVICATCFNARHLSHHPLGHAAASPAPPGDRQPPRQGQASHHHPDTQ